MAVKSGLAGLNLRNGTLFLRLETACARCVAAIFSSTTFLPNGSADL